jgi:superfamily II DNA or RNA helicase
VPRYFQRECVASNLSAIDNGFQRMLNVLATGMGKTNVITWQMEAFCQRGLKKQMAMAHREELLGQLSARVASLCPDFYVTQEGAGEKADPAADICVASVQSVGRLDNRCIEIFKPEVIFTDEAHRSAAPTYQCAYEKAGVYSNQCYSIGMTATPHRMDNQPVFGHSDLTPYQIVSYSKTLTQAIREGWLCDIRGYRCKSSVDISKIASDFGDYDAKELNDAINVEARNILAFNQWREVADGKLTIVFCVSVEHAKSVTTTFTSRGVNARYVEGKMHREDRKDVIEMFKDGKLTVLVNVDIATEGLDVPKAECVLILRPTKSFALYTQMIGRVARTLPGIIDGFPEQDQAEERISRILSSEKPSGIVIEIVDKSDDAVQRMLPSIASSLGLPPRMNMEGKTSTEVAESLEKIDKSQLAVLMLRDVDFSDLSTELKSVSIMDELRVAENVPGRPSLSWINLSGDNRSIYISCGNGRDATLKEDALGNWTLTMRSKDKIHEFEAGAHYDTALGRSEATIKKLWPDAVRIVTRARKGLESEASPAQRRLVKLLDPNIDQSVLLSLTKLEASNVIDLLRKRQGIQ